MLTIQRTLWIRPHLIVQQSLKIRQVLMLTNHQYSPHVWRSGCPCGILERSGGAGRAHRARGPVLPAGGHREMPNRHPSCEVRWHGPWVRTARDCVVLLLGCTPQPVMTAPGMGVCASGRAWVATIWEKLNTHATWVGCVVLGWLHLGRDGNGAGLPIRCGAETSTTPVGPQPAPGRAAREDRRFSRPHREVPGRPPTARGPEWGWSRPKGPCDTDHADGIERCPTNQENGEDIGCNDPC